ncbi:MAG: SCO family protein [Verrucomicrobia bacterium]|jgi:cytochrome oxidase Cu insertion factor (SCO1/SenC/PrrC family)|nr:SCO family protein [Verrucomicrobiota bacterium]|tara:strand:- start:10116 stop:10823 length:708 start_codon:yes stop_codon:yes gene_type:complete
MSKKTTIILFYCGVAVVCAAILALVNLVLVPSLRMKGEETNAFTNIKIEKKDEWYPIEKDLVATNQAGETVKLSDLRGKVWMVAEFFAICPHCAVRNGAELRSIYDEFKGHPDFHMVCISVDPETDDVEKLKDYAQALGADVEDWWFLNAGEEKATHEYLENTLKFLGVRERADAAQIEASGRFDHDMGLIAVDRDFKAIGKWDLAYQRSENGSPEGYKELKAQLKQRIAAELER